MFYDNRIAVIYKFIITGLSILLLVLGMENAAYAQPPNDLCINAIDISNGSWFTGTNQNATLSCTDHRTSNCTTPQQVTDMCCGTSGIEGTVWYKFTLSSSDTVFVDFRNAFPCNPVSLLGATTIQGFVLRRVGCVSNNLDTTKACFNPATVADFTVPAFLALAGVEYMVQIDTKKNSFSTCTCDAASSGTCHAYCPFEIRVRPKGVGLKLKDFNLSIFNNSVRTSWFYDFQENYSAFRITRKKLADNSLQVVSEGPVDNYHLSGYNFQFDDHTVKENGLYAYYLYGSFGGSYYEPIANKITFVGYVDEIDFLLIPNPAKDDLTISVSNIKDGRATYEIYSLLGVKIISGTIDSQVQYSVVNTCLFPRGIYFVKVVIGNKVVSKKLLLD